MDWCLGECDSAFTYLKDAQLGFNNYIAEQRKSGASNKHIKQLESDFNASYNMLWPKTRAAESVSSMKANQVFHSNYGASGYISKTRMKGDINPELNSLLELNQNIEANQEYYNSQFIDPNTGEEASDIARALYELSQQ